MIHIGTKKQSSAVIHQLIQTCGLNVRAGKRTGKLDKLRAEVGVKMQIKMWPSLPIPESIIPSAWWGHLGWMGGLGGVCPDSQHAGGWGQGGTGVRPEYQSQCESGTRHAEEWGQGLRVGSWDGVRGRFWAVPALGVQGGGDGWTGWGGGGGGVSVVLAFGVPPAGAFGRFGAQLVPVGLAVLVDEADLGLGWGRRWRRVLLLLGGPVGWGECLHDLPVQDAQWHTSHRVFEPVLRGNAVVHTPVRLCDWLQQDPMTCLQHLPVSTQHFPTSIFLKQPFDGGLWGPGLALQKCAAALHSKLHCLS